MSKSFSLITLTSLIILIFFSVFMWKFGDLLILVEARNYLLVAEKVMDYPQLWLKFLTPTGENSRYSSIVSFYLMKLHCGYQHQCINAVQLIISAAAGFFLSLHVYQVFRSVWVAVSLTALWLFSLPMLDAALWQAVNHDKLAALFSFATLFTAVYFLQRPNTLGYFIIANLLVSLLLVLAYNAKESAFFVMPLLWVYALLYARHWQQGLKLLLPSLFALYYVLFYFLRLSSGWQGHVMSSSIADNIAFYSNVLFNQSNQSSAWLWILPICLLVLLGLKLVLRPTAAEKLIEQKHLLYGLAFLLLTVVIALKTRYASTYYMLLPLAGLLFTCAAFMRTFWHYLLPLKTAAVLSHLSILILSGFMLSSVYLFWQNSLYYQQRLQHSDNFAQAYQRIRAQIPLQTGHEYIFAYPRKIPDHYYFLRSGATGALVDPLLLNFIYQVDNKPWSVQHIAYENVQDITFTPHPQRHLIVLDNAYRLLKIE